MHHVVHNPPLQYLTTHSITLNPFRGEMRAATLLCTKALSYKHQYGIGKDLAPKCYKPSPQFGLKPKVKRLQLGRLCVRNRAGGDKRVDSILEKDEKLRKLTQALLWTGEGVYVLWLFLLPYAPGDPVWAISSETINDLVGLSLNFFFILPLLNAGGVHLIEAPVLHPMSEGLFNFVIGWTFMFAPLLYSDRKRDSYKGSLDLLWGLQMFLTNTFLMPYMAIRLNKVDSEYPPRTTSQLGSIMTSGAAVVGLIGGAVCLVSAIWAISGRADSDFGSISDRWEFLLSYLSSERLAYAFIWDICLYSIFQPWLIGDNLQNIQEDKVGIVRYLRYVPVVGLIAYCLCLDPEEEY